MQGHETIMSSCQRMSGDMRRATRVSTLVCLKIPYGRSDMMSYEGALVCGLSGHVWRQGHFDGSGIYENISIRLSEALILHIIQSCYIQVSLSFLIQQAGRESRLIPERHAI